MHPTGCLLSTAYCFLPSADCLLLSAFFYEEVLRMACLKSFPGLFRTLRRRAARLFPSALLLACLLPCVAASGQQYGPDFYNGMRWRLVGPFRAGRVTAVAGIAGRPAVYHMATPGGGVWKTTDGGEVWKPIFDEARVASIGALALAPSNPEIVYVGTGEQTEGNGVYKP